MALRRLLLISQRGSSSGLPEHLAQGFRGSGYEVDVVDAHSLRLRRFLSAVRTFTPSKKKWHRMREMDQFYSVEAWLRNTYVNGKLLDQRLTPGDKILQVGGLYYPHPRFRELQYFLFFTYTMKLALKDGYSPWIVEAEDVGVFIKMETELYRHAQHIFVSAQFVKDNLVSEYRIASTDITVVGMGVDEFYTKNMQRAASPELTRKCLFVGFTWELKGGPDVIRAFAQAREAIPDIELLIVGPPPSVDMRGPGVKAMGPIRDRASLLKLYRDADLFLLPSRCDSWGFVFLEAMTQGVVCVGSTLNAMPEIIEDGVTGYLAAPGDHEQLAQLIVDFYQNPRRKGMMGAAARSRVSERFTWPHVINAILPRMSRTTPESPS